jgi:hypothetical protein
LSRDSAGMAFRFVTDAVSIAARWDIISANLSLQHMPASGVSGLDLYVKEAGRWRWLGFGWAKQKGENTHLLVSGTLRPGTREYLLYLPLYNGVHRVEIGLPPSAQFTPAPPYPANVKPIVFYGTSITQGGVASRAGMAYPAILGQWEGRAGDRHAPRAARSGDLCPRPVAEPFAKPGDRTHARFDQHAAEGSSDDSHRSS